MSILRNHIFHFRCCCVETHTKCVKSTLSPILSCKISWWWFSCFANDAGLATNFGTLYRRYYSLLVVTRRNIAFLPSAKFSWRRTDRDRTWGGLKHVVMNIASFMVIVPKNSLTPEPKSALLLLNCLIESRHPLKLCVIPVSGSEASFECCTYSRNTRVCSWMCALSVPNWIARNENCDWQLIAHLLLHSIRLA